MKTWGHTGTPSHMTGCSLCPGTSLTSLMSPNTRVCVLQIACSSLVWEARISRPLVPHHPSSFGTESFILGVVEQMPGGHHPHSPALGGGLGTSESSDTIVPRSYPWASKNVLLYANRRCCWACHGCHIIDGAPEGQG